MDASSWDIVLTDIVHCSFFGIDQSSFLIQTWIPPNPRRTNHQTSSYTTAASPSSSSLGSDTSSHGGFGCAALFLLCLCECVFRKIFVFVLRLLLSCAQNGSDRYYCVCSLGASLWRAGRETGCAFLYGVIAIGVVYQEMFSRFGGSLSLPQL